MNLSGRKVGGIRIEERLARGGMGEVYLGFHEKLKRRVAVKTVSERRRLKEMARARFIREARALSLLDHPNICKIYDYLEEEVGDLLVLEYIQGRGLEELIQEGMTRPRQLAVAEQLSDALAAAHERGVIHRDIKPSNVMVTPEGVVKVLDFGISRFESGNPGVSNPPAGDFDDSGRHGALQTRDGSLMGTLPYMSPEQARGDTATAASDMYALGLVLQQMFTGEPPFDPELSFGTLLYKVGSAESRPFRDPDEKLHRLVNRLKAPVPEARPGARDTHDALVEIITGPVRRRRRLMAWAAVSVVFVFAIIMTWQAARIQQEARRANREAARAGIAANTADEVSEFLVSLFEIVDPDGALGNKVTARELLDRGAQRLDQFDGPPLERARLMFTMGRMYRKLGLFDSAAPFLEQSLALRRDHAALNDLDLVDGITELADLYAQQDRFEEAESLIEEALKRRRDQLGPDHVGATRELLTAAGLEFARGRYQEGREYAEKALALCEKALPEDHPQIGEALAVLGGILDGLGEDAAALRVSQRAVAILEKAPNQAGLVDALNGVGKIHSQDGNWEEAEAVYRRALEQAKETLGSEHPRVGDLLNNIAVLYDNQDRYKESMDYQLQALKVWEKALGPEHSAIGMALGNLALGHLSLKEPQKALEKMERSIAIREKKVGADTPVLGWEYIIKARALAALKRMDAAREAWRHAIDLVKDSNSELEIITVNLETLANELQEAKHLVDAETLYRRANTWWDRVESADGENQARNCEQLAVILRATGREAEAESMEAQAKEYKDRREREGGS
ncbi:MAG: tetratricopeptide repeat protein [Acidobacteriota bacterium]|nr:tetratricopeptide repeat protein [Acidobacteriota bacterium]